MTNTEELRQVEADIRRLDVQITYEHDRLTEEQARFGSSAVRELRLCVLSQMLEQALNTRSENLRRSREGLILI